MGPADKKGWVQLIRNDKKNTFLKRVKQLVKYLNSPNILERWVQLIRNDKKNTFLQLVKYLNSPNIFNLIFKKFYHVRDVWLSYFLSFLLILICLKQIFVGADLVLQNLSVSLSWNRHKCVDSVWNICANV